MASQVSSLVATLTVLLHWLLPARLGAIVELHFEHGQLRSNERRKFVSYAWDPLRKARAEQVCRWNTADALYAFIAHSCGLGEHQHKACSP